MKFEIDTDNKIIKLKENTNILSLLFVLKTIDSECWESYIIGGIVNTYYQPSVYFPLQQDIDPFKITCSTNKIKQINYARTSNI